MSIKEKLFNDI